MACRFSHGLASMSGERDIAHGEDRARGGRYQVQPCARALPKPEARTNVSAFAGSNPAAPPNQVLMIRFFHPFPASGIGFRRMRSDWQCADWQCGSTSAFTTGLHQDIENLTFAVDDESGRCSASRPRARPSASFPLTRRSTTRSTPSVTLSAETPCASSEPPPWQSGMPRPPLGVKFQFSGLAPAGAAKLAKPAQRT